MKRKDSRATDLRWLGFLCQTHKESFMQGNELQPKTHIIEDCSFFVVDKQQNYEKL